MEPTREIYGNIVGGEVVYLFMIVSFGLLGWALRRTGCAEPSPCEEACVRPGACGWSRLFDPPPPPSPLPHKLLSSAAEPPAPMIVRAPPPGA